MTFCRHSGQPDGFRNSLLSLQAGYLKIRREKNSAFNTALLSNIQTKPENSIQIMKTDNFLKIKTLVCVKYCTKIYKAKYYAIFHTKLVVFHGIFQLGKVIFKGISSNLFQNNLVWYEIHSKWLLGGDRKGAHTWGARWSYLIINHTRRFFSLSQTWQ